MLVEFDCVDSAPFVFLLSNPFSGLNLGVSNQLLWPHLTQAVIALLIFRYVFVKNTRYATLSSFAASEKYEGNVFGTIMVSFVMNEAC